MKRKRYRINEKGKKRLMIGLSSFLFISIVITLGYYFSSGNDNHFGEPLLGKAVAENKSESQTSELKEVGAFKAGTIGRKKIESAITAGTILALQPSDTPEANPANPEVGNFFDASLFIGDSRMQGLMIYSGTTGTGYTEKGLDVTGAVTKAFIWNQGSQLTIPQALRLGQTFDRIIIKLGMNELGWRSTELFKERYGEFVATVKEAQPQAEIYLHAILPVTQAKSSDGSVYNNPRISEFNSLIKEVADEQGVRYIDVAPKLADENGFLPPEGTAKDGIHLKSDFCKEWLIDIKESIEEYK